MATVSGYKIFPGHGKRFVRNDGKLLIFANKKCERLFRTRKNPKEISWTVLYRKLHKKGIFEVTQKKRTKKVPKVQRPIDGNTLQSILERKNMSAETRTAQRQSAILAAKEKIKEKREKKKLMQSEAQARAATKATHKITQAKVKQPRTTNVRVGGKR